MTFEDLKEEAYMNGVDVIENYCFKSDRIDGLYCDGTIALSNRLENSIQKVCILAEELGHHESAVGDITDQSFVSNRKQELKGRLIAYNKMVGLIGIVDAFKHHCQNIHEVAEYLGVTEEFLNDTISYYKNKYGVYTTIENYAIIFEPAIAVLELI